jgi:hypothetical protein
MTRVLGDRPTGQSVRSSVENEEEIVRRGIVIVVAAAAVCGHRHNHPRGSQQGELRGEGRARPFKRSFAFRDSPPTPKFALPPPEAVEVPVPGGTRMSWGSARRRSLLQPFPDRSGGADFPSAWPVLSIAAANILFAPECSAWPCPRRWAHVLGKSAAGKTPPCQL